MYWHDCDAIDCDADNNIGDDGAKAIAQALERNTCLQQLDLSCMCFHY
jgi:hypothetical protein